MHPVSRPRHSKHATPQPNQLCRFALPSLLASLLFLLFSTTHLFAQSTPVEAGYRDHNFGNAPDPAITGEKPQSKIWFNDNFWWGSLWNPGANTYQIYKFDITTQSWSSTGVAIDDRPGTKADCLWDGQKLYVASQTFTESSGTTNDDDAARLYRYSYNAATKSYSLDGGFPVQINNSESEALVLDKDSTGKLWITWMQDGEVWINRSLGNDLSWGSPFQLPAQSTSAANDDISSIVAFDDDKIGVMWSDQVDAKIYFAVHEDGDPDLSWQPREIALQDAQLADAADDHVNLKTACDNNGNVYAVTKSSHAGNDDPRIYVLKRNSNGAWSNTVFSTRQHKHTRPIMVIDIENQEMYVFAKESGNFGDAILYKKTGLNDLQFDDDEGIIFIESSDDENINNPTSTKQCLTGTSDLVVLAADDVTKYYFHNTINLANSNPTPPVITSTAGQSGNADVPYFYDGDNLVEVTGSQPITFSATGPAGFAIDSNSGLVSWTPTAGQLGPHNISITATNAQGSDTQNFTVTIDPFAVRLTAGGSAPYTDTTGDTFLPDRDYSSGSYGYSGGNAYSLGASIGGTSDDGLYQTLRAHPVSFQYQFDVPASDDYDVELHFFAPAAGSGSFIVDVVAEGAVVLDDLDIEDEAGGTNTALIRTFTVNVSDGTLDLDFQKVNRVALVCAIAVTPSSGGTPQPDIAVSPLALSYGQVIIGQDADKTVTISNSGTADLSVSALDLDNSAFSLVNPPALPLTLSPGSDEVLTVRFSPSAATTETGTLDVVSDDPDEGTVSVALNGSGIPQPAGEVFRISAGASSDYTATNGDVFVADQAYSAGSYGYVGGRAYNLGASIGNTADDPLYQSLRANPQSISYKFDVSSAADFDVILHFMGPTAGSGNLVIDVSAEGALVFDDLDVENEAGGSNTALVRSFTVHVSDGTLDLDITKVNKVALVCAIEVIEQSAAPALAKRSDFGGARVAAPPSEFALQQNYPNPFNPETRIRYALAQESFVRLTVYNLLGEEVRTLVQGQQPAGHYTVRWDTRDHAGVPVPSGVYIYRLQSGDRASSRRMTLLR